MPPRRLAEHHHRAPLRFYVHAHPGPSIGCRSVHGQRSDLSALRDPGFRLLIRNPQHYIAIHRRGPRVTDEINIRRLGTSASST